MNRILKSVFLIFAAVSAIEVYAQSVNPKAPLTVNIDISRFYFLADSGYIEVYYSVNPENVILRKIDDTLKGAVILRTEIVNSASGLVLFNSSAEISVTVIDSASLKKDYIWKFNFALPYGPYRLLAYSYDKDDPARADSTKREFILKSHEGRVSVSDIDLCSGIVESGDKSGMFYKNSYNVVPNPGLVFGSKISPVIYYYSEFYNLAVDSVYSIMTTLEDYGGNIIKQRGKKLLNKRKNSVEVGAMNIHNIPSGKYRFALSISDTAGAMMARTDKTIYIYNPDVKATATAPLKIETRDFLGMTDGELEDEFRKAHYIATQDEIEMFDKLKSVKARRDFLAVFWKNVESGMRQRKDILRATYMDRVNIATQRYRAMGREGWKTDRGRIYILYGQPDEIQRFPSSGNAKPYEIWNYFQIENGVMFVFVDRTGFGEYSLVHSTKSGELGDENWERFLR